MSGRIHIREVAKQDVAEQWDYLRERSPDAAERFVVAVKETFDRLLRMPGLGRQREYDNPALVGIRMRAVGGFEKYLIFYRQTDDGIEVIRILHSARDIAAIMREEG